MRIESVGAALRHQCGARATCQGQPCGEDAYFRTLRSTLEVVTSESVPSKTSNPPPKEARPPKGARGHPCSPTLPSARPATPTEHRDRPGERVAIRPNQSTAPGTYCHARPRDAAGGIMGPRHTFPHKLQPQQPHLNPPDPLPTHPGGQMGNANHPFHINAAAMLDSLKQSVTLRE